MASAYSPWGNRKGRNARAPSPAKAGSWSAMHLTNHSPEHLVPEAHVPKTKYAQSASAGTGIIGPSSRARACQASAAEHAEHTQQAKHAQRPRRASKGKQGAPLQLSKPAQSVAAANADGLPNGGADLSPRLRGGPQVGGARTLCKNSMPSSYSAKNSMQTLSRLSNRK